MNFNKQPSVVAGAFLIGLGLVWWLNLWPLLLPGVLLAGGALGYVQRRRMGRLLEAVQIGLWGAGLALLFLLGFVWPGVLFLAGASLLVRGREGRVDAAVQQLAGRVRGRVTARRAAPVQQVPIATVYQAPAQPQAPQSSTVTGETTRL